MVKRKVTGKYIAVVCKTHNRILMGWANDEQGKREALGTANRHREKFGHYVHLEIRERTIEVDD